MYALVLSIMFIVVSLIGPNRALSAATAPLCPSLSESRLTFQRLKEQIQNPACNIRSIEGVLRQLPPALRSNYLLAYRSHSPQGPHKADYLNPRVLLTDAQFDYIASEPNIKTNKNLSFVLAFNGGNLSSPRHHSLEMVEVENLRVNLTPDFLAFHDITFPVLKGGETWEQIQSQINFSGRNPPECVLCHSNPARFIWSAYPLWPGFYGSNNFDRTMTEVNAYKRFAANAHNHRRYKYLIGTEKHIHSDNNNFESLNFNHEGLNPDFNKRVALITGRRFARILKELPQYEKYKYAYFASWADCPSIPSFLPEDLRRFHDEYFEKSLDPSIQGTPQELISNIQRIQKDYIKHTQADLERILMQLKEIAGGNVQFIRLMSDSFMRMGPYRGAISPIGARYLSHPRGVSMTDWFMDLETDTYRVFDGGPPGLANARGLMAEDPSFEFARKYLSQDPLKYNNEKLPPSACLTLKQRSLQALEDVKVPETVHEPKAILAIAGNYPATFLNTCAACHDTKIANVDIPLIPFAHPDLLSEKIKQDPAFGAELLRRVNSRDFQMPPDQHLETDELAAIQKFVDGLKK